MTDTIWDEALCKQCKAPARTYFVRFDRYGCLACDTWLEPDHCNGSTCDGGFEHSGDRKPSECGDPKGEPQ